MKSYQLLLVLLLVTMAPVFARAQRDWTWVFGDGVQMHFPGGGNPVVDTSVQRVRAFEMGACISDTNGDLMMYTNHWGIYNGQGQFVDRIYFSDESTCNGALIVPTYELDVVYLFAIGHQCSQNIGCLRITRYDARLNGGLGGVGSIDNQIIYDNVDGLSERLSAVPHANGRDWWVYAHSVIGKWYYRWLVKDKEILGPYQQNIGSDFTTLGGGSNIGEMTFSNDGNKAALAALSGIVDVYDVDRCTGTFYSHRSLGTPSVNIPGPNTYYGCAFSSDGSKLYVNEELDNNGTKVYQWDFNAPDLAASKTLIHASVLGMEFGQMQLGPDARIYLTNWSNQIPQDTGMKALSIIRNPDSSGAACGFNYAALPIGRPANTLHLPNLPNYNTPALLTVFAEAGPSLRVCAPSDGGDSVTLGGSGPVPPGGVWHWTGAGIGDSTSPRPRVLPAVSGWYHVEVVDTALGSPCGLTTDSVWVEVVDASAHAVADAGRGLSLCAGDSAWMGVDPVPGRSYVWMPAVGLASDTAAKVRVGAALLPPGSPDSLVAYRLRVEVPGLLGGCAVDEDSVVVRTLAVPEALAPGFAGADGLLCVGDTVSLGGSTANGWLWEWTGAGLIGPVDGAGALAAPLQDGWLAVEARDSASDGACQMLRDSAFVVVERPFIHAAPRDTAVCAGGCVPLGLAAQAGLRYRWEPVLGLEDALSALTVARPVVMPPVGASAVLNYTLYITSDSLLSARCRELAFPVRLTVEGCARPGLLPPGRALLLGPLPGPVALRVWDAAGRLVFVANDYAGEWGADAPAGVYVYRVGTGGCADGWTGRVVVLR